MYSRAEFCSKMLIMIVMPTFLDVGDDSGGKSYLCQTTLNLLYREGVPLPSFIGALLICTSPLSGLTNRRQNKEILHKKNTCRLKLNRASLKEVGVSSI